MVYSWLLLNNLGSNPTFIVYNRRIFRNKKLISNEGYINIRDRYKKNSFSLGGDFRLQTDSCRGSEHAGTTVMSSSAKLLTPISVNITHY